MQYPSADVSDPSAPAETPNPELSDTRKAAIALSEQWEQSLSAEERAAISGLRGRVAAAGLLNSRTDHATVLYPWVLNFKNDVTKAFAAFETSYREYRPKYRLSSFVSTEGGPVPALCLERQPIETLKLFSRVSPFGFHKTDKRGRPILISRMGLLDMDKLIEFRKATPLEGRLEMQAWQNELTVEYRLPACSVAAGKYVGQVVNIVDMHGWTLKIFDAEMRKNAKANMRIGQDNYPSLVGQMFLINVPFVFYGMRV